MRIKLLALGSLLVTVLGAGCAGTPPPAAQAQSVAAPVSPAAAPVSPAAAAVSKDGPLTGEKVLALQHEGYTIINKNGEVLYCRAEAKTGTRISRDTVCLTEKEMVALREETQRDLGNIMRQRPAPQGN
jgi:hypothetical protein